MKNCLKELKIKNENDLFLYHNKFILSGQSLVSFWKKNFVVINEFECLLDKYDIDDKIIFIIEFKQSENEGFGFQIVPKFVPEYIEQAEFEFHLFIPEILVHDKTEHKSTYGVAIESIFDCSIFTDGDNAYQPISGELVFILKKIYAKNNQELITKQQVLKERELINQTYNKIRQDIVSVKGINKIAFRLNNNLLKIFWKGETIKFDNKLTMDIDIKNDNTLNQTNGNEKLLYLLDDMLIKFGDKNCDQITIQFGCAKNSTENDDDDQFTLYT
eukprot:95620_1